jgi:hypothetical protein
MHACYTQNFFARHGAAARGARLLGYRGTVEFDWYANEVVLHSHHVPRTETHRLDRTERSHFGGDSVLAHNFVQVMRGEALSISPLSEAALSTSICLAAKRSAETHSFEAIEKF